MSADAPMSGDLVLVRVALYEGHRPDSLGPMLFLGYDLLPSEPEWTRDGFIILKEDGPTRMITDDWSIKVISRFIDARDPDGPST